MSIATTTQLSTLTVRDFTDLTRRTFVDNPEKITPMARQLFKVDSVGTGNGTEKLYQEYDTGTFAKFKGEGENVSKTQAGSGYNVLARLKRYGVEIDITFEERMYNQYESVKQKLINLSNFGVHRQELDLTHRLTFSAATSYVNMDGQTVTITVGDGLALASASHTLASATGTYSNIITGSPVFSEANLAIAELVGSTNVLSNYGDKRVFNFNKLFIADYPAVRNLARQVLQSDAQISAPNSEVINVYKAKYELVVLPYLATTATGAYDSAKKNYWGLVAAGQWNAYLAEWEPENLVTPSVGNNLVDAHSDVWTYGVRIGYDIAIVSGRGILISNNAS
jgi:hypothetical protein